MRRGSHGPICEALNLRHIWPNTVVPARSSDYYGSPGPDGPVFSPGFII
jgi:hypothetical protein